VTENSDTPSDTPSDTVGLVFEAVRQVAQDRAIDLTLDTPIIEMGLSSIERLEILGLLEERLGGRFPESVLIDLETCGEVVKAVETYLGQKPRSRPADTADLQVPTEHYRIEEFPECVQLRQSLGILDAFGLENPFFQVQQSVVGSKTTIDDRQLINFASFNYLDLSGHPSVMQAAKDAIDRYGTSSGASPLVSGENQLHRDLDRGICEFLGTEDAMTFCAGHSTNESVIGHIVGPGDLIVYDELCHNSIVQGAILSGAARRPFTHNDFEALDGLLHDVRGDYRRVLILIEGIYSMDGDMPQLPEFIEVKRRHKAIMMIDEAHSIGTVGRSGRGIGDVYDVDRRDVEIWMGTMSKALGSVGGYITGSSELIQYLQYTTPSFVFAVRISPPNTAAALASIRVLQDEPERVVRLADRSKLFLQLAKERGMNTGTSSGTAVVPAILGDSVDCVKMSQAMIARGVNVRPILHPAVEETAARMRFFINSEHTEEDIRYTADAAAEELARVNPKYARPV
jgi:8-amino-7-oxononanoate synthase